MSPDRADPIPAPSAPPASRADAPTRVRLVAQCGPCQGQVLEVRAERFFIGSDPNCQLRPVFPELAGVHAVIEQIKGVLFLRDLDTQIGTTLNGAVIRDNKKEIFDRDEIRIGPLVLTISIGVNWDQPGLSEVPVGWPLVVPATPAAEPGESSAAPSLTPHPTGEQKGAKGALTFEVIGAVLKMTPLSPEYDDETTVAPLRFDLQALVDQPLPRRVVVDLSHVTYLSSRGVGVLLAHFQGLARIGGVMRIARVHPTRVLPVLKQMKLEMFIDLYATVEEAVADAWE